MESLLPQLADYGISFTSLAIMIYLLVLFFRQEKKERQDKDAEQNLLEKEFREYLKQQAQDHHKIIQENTEAFRDFSQIMSRLIEKLK